jgi:peptide/nickel transport system permease protein
MKMDAASVLAPTPVLSPQRKGKEKTFWSHAKYVLSDNPFTLVAACLFAMFVLLALVGPWIVPFDPLATNVGKPMSAPNWSHWFGTDSLGRDILSRVVVATRIDFVIALSAVGASFAIGGLIGAAAGYFGGWLDRIVIRVCDMVMSFPLFVLAMGIVAALGNSVFNIIIATAVVNLPFYIRVARTEVNVRREAGFVEAARLAGNGDARILLCHLIPNAMPPMMVQVSLNMGWAILNAAGLSFIGLGVSPPAAEWGIMVAEGATYIISGEWWVALFPGSVLMLAVFTFNLLGDGLRDLIDPRRRT